MIEFFDVEFDILQDVYLEKKKIIVIKSNG